MPVPMMAPIPNATRAGAESTRLSLTPEASSDWSSSIDLVARSWLGMGPPESVVGADYGGPLLLTQLGGQERGEHLDQRFIHLRRAGNDVASLAKLASRQSADTTACFRDQQRPRRGIPRRQSDLPERIDAAGRDISHVQRCGARAPDA